VRFAHLFGDAIDKIPNIVGKMAAIGPVGSILAATGVALANRRVTVGGHDRNRVKIVNIKLRAGVTHRFFEQFLVGIAKLVFAVTGRVMPLAAIEREPLGMGGEYGVVAGHRIHAVGDLQPKRIAQAQAHRPIRGLGTIGCKAKVKPPHGKVGLARFIERRQRDCL
jgi:hypothetical protein